ncbi:putative membrane protein [Pedobacter sp. UYP30]|uniref:hypothetical protein n=1 Tax=Pedobacter sp. UYP30 TaxID=1756400 RepID=UPI003399A048
MDQLHVHLIINHLPIIGTLLAILVLVYAILVKSVQTEIAAYGLFILCALGAVVAYLTGEGAEDGVEKIQGITKHVIERHEDFSVYALTALIILGVLSIVGVIAAVIKFKFSKTLSSFILIISIIAFGLAAWTGYLGGQIRHTELNSPIIATEIHGQEKHDSVAVSQTKVKLNKGKKWQSDSSTNKGINDLIALINSSPSESASSLKEKLMGRVNQMIKECTMPPKTDAQLHNYLIPLIDKIKGLENEPSAYYNMRQDILSYLKTYGDYFE